MSFFNNLLNLFIIYHINSIKFHLIDDYYYHFIYLINKINHIHDYFVVNKNVDYLSNYLLNFYVFLVVKFIIYYFLIVSHV